MSPRTLRDLVVDALDDLKGNDILALNVEGLTTITDYMIVVSGTSNRHVKALVDNTIEAVKAGGAEIFGVEGRESNEWVLLDLGDVIVHVMQSEARGFYELERLWSELPEVSSQDREPQHSQE